jgi:hypothetical protein
MGRISNEDKLNTLIKRRSSYCVRKTSVHCRVFPENKWCTVQAARESGNPPKLNKTKLKAKASPELDVTLRTPSHQRLGRRDTRQRGSLCSHQRLNSPKQHELLRRKGQCQPGNVKPPLTQWRCQCGHQGQVNWQPRIKHEKWRPTWQNLTWGVAGMILSTQTWGAEIFPRSESWG